MSRRLRSEDLTGFAIPKQPAVSPDGSQCAYVLTTCDVEEDRNVNTIWRVGTRSGDPHQLTRGTNDTAPAWSPDGTRIAFLRATDDGPAQLWSLPAAGGEPERCTELPLGAGAPVWSPDGTRIAFAAFTDPVHGAPDDDKPGPPVVADRLDYQSDGVGLFGTRHSHLFVLDVAGGDCRQVTEGDWHAGPPAWSPDGTKLAFVAAIAADSDLTWRVPVWVVDVSGPLAPPTPAALPDGESLAVRWASDGTALLVVGLPTTTPQNARLLRVPLAGQADTAEPVDLTGDWDRGVLPNSPDGFAGGFEVVGDRAVFCVGDRGRSRLYAIDQHGGEPTPVLTGGARGVRSVAAAGDTAVVVLMTEASAGEIVAVDLAGGGESVRTHHGENVADVDWFPREEREFTVSDGTVVHGWLIRDPDVPGPAPLLLDIHGGPHAAWDGLANGVEMYHHELAARGWSILLLNPRGSDGYGNAFAQAALGHWGEADARDVLEPIDQLVTEGVADPDRLAVTGYSYGSYLTCYLTGRDNRFRAAVVGGVLSNLTSMSGTSDAGRYLTLLEFGQPSWDAPDRYAASSPLAQVDQVTTPTLILQGTADARCPIGQAQEWHAALRTNGVPSRLVLYPGGSHEFVVSGPPSHRVDVNRRTVEWLLRHTGDVRRPPVDADHWQRRLTVLADRHGVPGATLGILRWDGLDDEPVVAAAGVLNVNTGVPVTADSLFQIGSITKVWTTTLVQQLADEGRLDLDTPVVDLLPELALADADARVHVTMRHLLTHTSGVDGDVFTDTGRGDDCVARYVAKLGEVAQNHPLGATWSYCNSGFVLAGRVIEQLTAGTWDQAVRERLVEPLGLTHTVTLPEEALLHRAAMGHESDGTRSVVWGLPRSVGPAGLLTCSAADVLEFARLHLAGGVTRDGKRVLSARRVEEMTAHQADLPVRSAMADSWGLGWMRAEWDGRRIVGHDGSTVGQSAYLRMLPDEGLAVVLLTNSDNGKDLYEALFREVFAALADVDLPRPPEPPVRPVHTDPTPHLGTYERASTRLEVFAGEQGPMLRETTTGPLAELTSEPVEEYALVPVGQDEYLVRGSGQTSWRQVAFHRLPSGDRYVHFGSRATPRKPD